MYFVELPGRCEFVQPRCDSAHPGLRGGCNKADANQQYSDSQYRRAMRTRYNVKTRNRLYDQNRPCRCDHKARVNNGRAQHANEPESYFFGRRLFLVTLSRFLFSAAFASTGNRKPDRSRPSIAFCSIEVYVSMFA